jgi:hypothetical protein
MVAVMVAELLAVGQRLKNVKRRQVRRRRRLMRYRVFLSFVLIFLVTVASAGCAGIETPAVPSDEPTTLSTPTPEPHPTTSVPTPSAAPTVGLVPSEAQEVVALARQDLAERLDVDPRAIELISVEAVEWPDASLGCPKPGQMYAQVITPGFRVVLEARGETYVYHTDRGQTVVLCEEEPVMGTPTTPSPVESELDDLIQSAKEDLAQRLSISVERIEVVEARSVVWPNAAMGCPQPGMQYKQVPYDGALIRLRADGRVYEYHSGGARGLFLCEQPSGTSKSTPPKLDLSATPPGSEDS